LGRNKRRASRANGEDAGRRPDYRITNLPFALLALCLFHLYKILVASWSLVFYVKALMLSVQSFLYKTSIVPDEITV